MTDKTLEKVVGAPAMVLEKTIDTSKQISNNILETAHIKKATNYWHTLGPGLTTGAADDDPSGIATYSQTGSQYGYQLLWLSLFTFPLMAIIQEMCARIGLVTGRGLAGNIRIYYPKWVLYVCTILLVIANTLNLGADLGAMAKATQLLLPTLNFGLLVGVFTVVSLTLQIFTTYAQYAKYLKWLAFILFSYVLSALSLNLNITELAKHTVIPSLTFSKDQIFLICGILGTTISPYLFFWQTSQEVEEDIKKGKTTVRLRQGTTPTEIKDMRIDVWSGMFVSNLIMFFIIAVCSATLFSHGITNIATASDAAAALRPIAGNGAYLLFAIGIIGTGMLAVPILAGSASYALSESFRWKSGLYRKLKEAPSFYGFIMISMLVGLSLNFVGLDPIKVLIISAVANGMVAPVILILILRISGSKKVMGGKANGIFSNSLGWIITLAMIIVGIATIVSLIA